MFGAVLVMLAGPVAAQVGPPLDLPSDRRREIPIPDDDAAATLDLEQAPTATTAPAVSIALQAIRVEGNTVLDPAELESIAAPYLERPLEGLDLEQLRLDVTQAYVDRGYLTSGALLPDQDLGDGRLVIHVYEGRIETVVVEGLRHLRDAYVRDRVAPRPSEPVHVPTLERRLQLLQRDPMIASVHAKLEPGPVLGTSVLRMRVEESERLGLELDVSNDRAPPIGAENVGTAATARDVTSFGDTFRAAFRASAGLRDFESGWVVPINRHDTRFGLRGRFAKSRVVEDPFAALDIDSDFAAIEAAIAHPVFRDADDDLRLGLAFEWRRGRSFVGGEGFSFAEGTDRGRSVVFPIRLVQDWLRRNRHEVVALRSKISFGLPIAGATDLPGASTDATYVSWIVQGQWTRRFPDFYGLEVFARSNLQLASDPLPPIEQFSLGGHASVRGYRENTLVADEGFDAGLELRLPVWRRADGRSIVQLATFTDVGAGWSDADRADSFSQTLASVGLGLRVQFARWVYGETYWGHRLIDIPNPENDLQDQGLYFRVVGTSW